jgi:hypothetical protein
MNEVMRPGPSDPGAGWSGPPANSVSVVRESQETAQIAAALVSALSKLKNPPRNRSVEVSTKGGGRYSFRYATLDKILDAARPVLAAEGVALYQPISTNERGGLVLLTRLLHRSGEWMETSIPLPSPGSDPQGFGSAVTYLRRYAVTALLGIASDEDDDANRAAGNHLRDVTPRHERLRDEADRAVSADDKLAALAKSARTHEEGARLISGWAQLAADVPQDKRGEVLRRVSAGLANSLGAVPSAAFAQAARMRTQDDQDAFAGRWGGEWSAPLMAMQQQAPEAYKALQSHVAAAIRRVKKRAEQETERQPEEAR